MNGLACPRCGTALHAQARGVDGCAACGGVFVHEALASTVDALVQKGASAAHAIEGGAPVAGAPLPTAKLREAAACPVCANAMHKHRVGLALEVDACEHGTWFDAGELPRLRDAVARGLVVVAVRHEAVPPERTRGDAPALKPARKSHHDDVQVVHAPLKDLTDADGHLDYEAQAKRLLALDHVAAMTAIRRERAALDNMFRSRRGRRSGRRGEDWLTKGLTALLFPDPPRHD